MKEIIERNITFFDAVEIIEVRRNGRQFHVLKPCKIYHVIGVDKDGKFPKLSYFTYFSVVQNLFKETESSLDEIKDEFEDEDNDT